MAFKEWAVVVDALMAGEQILILRKGGIHEGRGGFQVEYPRFWLFPTLFHQQRDSVLPVAQARYDAIAPTLPGPDRVKLEAFCEVADWRLVESIEAVNGLRGQHIWKDEVIAERFDWGKRKNIFALAVRVFRLPTEKELPVLASYAGCKSWIELAEEVSTEGAAPVLNTPAFELRLKEFRESLGTAQK